MNSMNTLVHRKTTQFFGSIALRCFVVFFCVLTLGTLFVGVASAATLLVSPANSQVSVGNITSVKIVVATDQKPINNTDLILLFPSDLLEVVSVSKSTSIFSLWVEEPTFSNIEGKISLNGGVPNPGFTGQNGEVATVTFRAKKQGNATLVFSDSAVRQNDGLGTDILTTKGTGFIQINTTQPLEVPVASVGNVPPKPLITSSSHPSPDEWYAVKSATFSWLVPRGVTALQTLLGKLPNSTPTILYDSSVSQRTVNDLTDGVLYFHLRYQNGAGWGPIAHQKIQIDTTPPEQFAVEVVREKVRDVVTLAASDATSGIDQYTIQIDTGETVTVKADTLPTNGAYTLPVQSEGAHVLRVIAYDKAGNYTESTAAYSSSLILPPVLRVVPTEVTKNNSIEIIGTSEYPNTQVVISLENKKGDVQEYTTKTQSDGSFAFTVDEMKDTGYTNISAKLVFSETLRSASSKSISVLVSDTQLVSTTKLIVLVLIAVILVLILVTLLIIVAYVGWHKFFGVKKKLARDLEQTADNIHQVLIGFKGELNKQLIALERVKEDRDLNRREEKIFADLKNRIDSIDKFIDKSLNKIIKP